jgi:hypothetical protein
MSKRLNPHRRLLAAQAKALAAERSVQSAVNGADMAKLQQGRVRSPLTTIYRGHVSPRPAIWEGSGKPGKVVRGQLKLVLPGTKLRFAPK